MDKGADSYRRFLNGDESGLAELIRDYKDGLILYINSFVGNIHTAEELAEDAFIKLFTRRPKDSGKASFKTWLYTIGRNQAIDYLRRSRGKKEQSAEEIAEAVSDTEMLESLYIKEERKIAVHKALSKLKSEYRQVLWLIYFEGLSNKEAARVMKKSVHGTETLAYRARQYLKSVLEKEDFIYDEEL